MTKFSLLLTLFTFVSSYCFAKEVVAVSDVKVNQSRTCGVPGPVGSSPAPCRSFTTLTFKALSQGSCESFRAGSLPMEHGTGTIVTITSSMMLNCTRPVERPHYELKSVHLFSEGPYYLSNPLAVNVP